MGIDWAYGVRDQLDWHWAAQLRPRLDGLSDGEYLWEPVAGCWSVRPRGDTYAIDWVFPPPEPAPVTTIAWRLGHLITGVFGMRAASHFGAPAMDYDTFAFSATAAGALTQLDDAYASWRDGVATLDAEGLARLCGPAEGPYAEHTLFQLILHINREAIHHGAEIALLRDLYLRRQTG
jgi:hypothetical protein